MAIGHCMCGGCEQCLEAQGLGSYAPRCLCGWRIDALQVTADGCCPRCGEPLEEPEDYDDEDLRRQPLH